MDYRYVILGSNGEPARAEDWRCPSDVEAIERASRDAHPFGAELWCGDRRVSTFPARIAPAEA
jgi:hypothetical protein